MAEPSKALHRAVLAALEVQLSCSVYDGVPQGAAYPYVTLDRVVTGAENLLSQRVDRYFQYLTVWSRTKGQAEVLGIFADIETALQGQRLTLDTGRVAYASITRKGTSREPDNETFQGSVTVEYLIEH